MADQTNPGDPPNQQSSSAKPELQQHELVDKLAPDPSQVQPLVILSGFLGQSPRAGYWRLYLTPALGEYVEILEGDIVNSQSPGPGQPANAPTTLWVRSGTPLQYTSTTSRQVQAEFLQGSLATGFKARATNYRAVSPRAGMFAPRIGNYTNIRCSAPCGSDYGCHSGQQCGLTDDNCYTQGVQCITESCPDICG